MRSDVWPTIRRYDESLDKLEQYVREIEWSPDEFRTLLFKRIEAEAKKHKVQMPIKGSSEREDRYEERVLELIFVPRVQWGDKEVQSYRVIHTLSYERPRWAVQLCKLARTNALRNGQNRITKADIDDVWGDYGSRRIADLVAEHKHQCPEVEELITAFRGAQRLFPRDDLFVYIKNRVLNHMNPHIDSRDVRSQIEVARFLFRTGFIIARSEEQNGEYEHYTFKQMPDLLSSRTDQDYNIKWEIHPCYREALDIKKLNRSARARRGVGTR
ncbi:MAG: hypothetical protein HY962_14210 [Ignavibacteriae bacterium]|nr:hypothetical protein [Ignavibacteriota bacterium]